MRFLPHDPGPGTLRVAVIGLGYVGSCVAAALAGRGVSVVGIDTDARHVAALGAGRCRFAEEGLPELLAAGVRAGRLRFTTAYDALRTVDVVLVCVGTPVHEDGSLADEQLLDATAELAARLRPGQLVIVKSTVPPGTVRGPVRRTLERGGLVAGEDFGLAFTPERLSEGSALRDLRTITVVAGGIDAGSGAEAATFWRVALGVEVIGLDSLEAAELVKLASNWWLDVNIALGNELAKFAALYGVDVLDVIRATNTMPVGAGTANVLLPSVGVGGSCLTKDPLMVAHTAAARGLRILSVPAARAVNDGMPAYTAQLIVDELTKLGKDPAASKICVLGLAFKNDTGDLRATPTRPAVAELDAACGEVALYDPLVDPAQAEALFGRRPATDLHAALAGADCVAVLALHREFADLDFAALPVAAGCLVLDGRAYYPRDTIARLRELGFHYRGVGR